MVIISVSYNGFESKETAYANISNSEVEYSLASNSKIKKFIGGFWWEVTPARTLSISGPKS